MLLKLVKWQGFLSCFILIMHFIFIQFIFCFGWVSRLLVIVHKPSMVHLSDHLISHNLQFIVKKQHKLKDHKTQYVCILFGVCLCDC
jgi:hypothetical protein